MIKALSKSRFYYASYDINYYYIIVYIPYMLYVIQYNIYNNINIIYIYFVYL